MGLTVSGPLTDLTSHFPSYGCPPAMTALNLCFSSWVDVRNCETENYMKNRWPMVRQKGLTFNGLADEVVLEQGAEIRFSILLFPTASIPLLGPWKFRDKSWGCRGAGMRWLEVLFCSQACWVTPLSSSFLLLQRLSKRVKEILLQKDIGGLHKCRTWICFFKKAALIALVNHTVALARALLSDKHWGCPSLPYTFIF